MSGNYLKSLEIYHIKRTANKGGWLLRPYVLINNFSQYKIGKGPKCFSVVGIWEENTVSSINGKTTKNKVGRVKH